MFHDVSSLGCSLSNSVWVCPSTRATREGTTTALPCHFQAIHALLTLCWHYVDTMLTSFATFKHLLGPASPLKSPALDPSLFYLFHNHIHVEGTWDTISWLGWPFVGHFGSSGSQFCADHKRDSIWNPWSLPRSRSGSQNRSHPPNGLGFLFSWPIHFLVANGWFSRFHTQWVSRFSRFSRFHGFHVWVGWMGGMGWVCFFFGSQILRLDLLWDTKMAGMLIASDHIWHSNFPFFGSHDSRKQAQHRPQPLSFFSRQALWTEASWARSNIFSI